MNQPRVSTAYRRRHNPPFSSALSTQHSAPPLRAFTLVELLVVITIIGLLVGLLIPVIGKVKRASQGAATQAQMTAIATAIQSYYSDFRAYPGPLPNSVLGGWKYATPVTANITDYVTSYTPPTTFGYSKFDFEQANHDATEGEQVSGSENLVLGLLGGLELEPGSSTICYDSFALFPDGATPAPKGAENLNANLLKRFASYLQVKPGDITPPSGTPAIANFVDSAQRICNDTMIPEFLDKSSQQMPILYLRTNPGSLGVASFAGKDELGNPNIYQYDLAQVAGYTIKPAANAAGAIGTNPNDPTRDHHGLQGLSTNLVNTSVTPNVFYPIVGNPAQGNGQTNGANFGGTNGLLYLHDPNLPVALPAGGPMTNALGTPRQKDGYILISAGPDGVYGTADDFIYPGSLNP